MVIYYVISAACGVSVACAEIISRYKDEPLKTIFCWWGLAYISFNALLSILGFGVLIIAEVALATNPALQNLQYALLAGFGAAVIMRAKLFNLRLTGGERASVGPDFVIDTFLSTLDRQIDRQRAYRRAKIIMKSMADVDYEMVRMPIIILLTRSMQGITESEMKDLGQKLAEIESTEELSNQDRAYALGFLALNLAGDDFFKEVFNLNERQKYLIAPDTITDTNNKANHYS